MSLRFDHAVILVRDLQAAIADYQALGFNVFFGGEHAGGKTHNALIVFQDGAYLELLAPTKPEFIQQVDPADRSSFLFMFADGEGFGGYALLADNLAAETEAMQKRGLNVQMRTPGGRLRPDGQELRWRSAMIGSTMTPFFIQDDTPRNLRVPDDSEKTAQANGVTGVVGIEIGTPDLGVGIERYQHILGNIPAQRDDAQAKFLENGFELTLRANPNVETDALSIIRLRGDQNKVLEKALTHGAHIELVK